MLATDWTALAFICEAPAHEFISIEISTEFFFIEAVGLVFLVEYELRVGYEAVNVELVGLVND